VLVAVFLYVAGARNKRRERAAAQREPATG
jgi:hypothetical protein